MAPPIRGPSPRPKKEAGWAPCKASCTRQRRCTRRTRTSWRRAVSAFSSRWNAASSWRLASGARRACFVSPGLRGRTHCAARSPGSESGGGPGIARNVEDQRERPHAGAAGCDRFASSGKGGSGEEVAGPGGGEDGLSRGGADAGHGHGIGPGHRFHQARRDPLGRGNARARPGRGRSFPDDCTSHSRRRPPASRTICWDRDAGISDSTRRCEGGSGEEVAGPGGGEDGLSRRRC